MNNDDRRRGLKLIDLMAAVLVVALLFGLLIPFLNDARHARHRIQCQNNLRNIGVGLVQFQASKGRFPNAGTFRDNPEDHRDAPTRSSIYQAVHDPSAFAPGHNPLLRNWVVDVLPFLDSSDLANAWDRKLAYDSPGASMLYSAPPSNVPNSAIASTAMPYLVCPEDPTSVPNRGNLSYVVNGGFVRWPAVPIGWDGSAQGGQSKNGPVLQWAPEGRDWRDTLAVNRKLGVMFLGTDTGTAPWDVATTPADIVDGASLTILLGENTLAGYSPGNAYSGGLATNWACPLPNFCMFIASDDVCRSAGSATNCLAGQLRPMAQGRTGPGWAAANRWGSPEAINYGREFRTKGSFPFVNSGHPGGANFIMCDGSAKFISETIDGKVYAELITPAGTALPPELRQSQPSAAAGVP